ncbi:MAG: porin [Spongiibacteraceae bacterium]
MKRKLLPLLIAGLTAASANIALAGAPTVYGKVNVTVHKNDFQSVAGGQAVDSTDNWSMESNASRLGVKGDYDVSADLKAIYKLEYEIAVDDGVNSNTREFSARNIYAGMQGGWGTLIAGRNDTPLKLSQGEVDRFNDLPLADIQNFMVGENRADNMIMYSSPSFSGFNVTLGLVEGEDDGVTDGEDDDSLADTISAAATYTNKMLYLALAMDSNMNESTDTIRFVGEVSFGPAKIGAIYQTAEGNENYDVISTVRGDLTSFDADIDPTAATAVGFDEQDAYVLNGEVKLGGPWKLKAQYGYSESTTANGFDDAESTLMALGIDYKLNDNAKLFAYYASLETEGDSAFTDDTVEDKTLAVGFDFKF